MERMCLKTKLSAGVGDIVVTLLCVYLYRICLKNTLRHQNGSCVVSGLTDNTLTPIYGRGRICWL